MSSNINVKGITLSFADLFKQNLPPSQTHKVALPAKTSSNKIPSTSNFAADLTPSKSDSKSIADQQIIAAALSSSTCEAMSNDVLPLATPAPTCASFESTSSNDAQLFEESLVLTETLKSDPFDNQRVVQENGSANLTTTLAPTTSKPINIQKIVKRRGSIGKEIFILSQDDVVVSIDDDGVVSIDDDLPAADNAASQLLHLQPNHHDHNRNYPESSIPPSDDHLNSQSTPSSPPAVNVWLVRQEAMKKHDRVEENASVNSFDASDQATMSSHNPSSSTSTPRKTISEPEKFRRRANGARGPSNRYTRPLTKRLNPHHVPQQQSQQPQPQSIVYYPIVEMETVKWMILGQIEYYFSVENLCRDVFFRMQMDSEGFVPVALIAGFNRVQSICPDIRLIYEALKFSHTLEVCDEKVRLKHDWHFWLFPSSSQSTSTPPQQLPSHQ